MSGGDANLIVDWIGPQAVVDGYEQLTEFLCVSRMR